MPIDKCKCRWMLRGQLWHCECCFTLFVSWSVPETCAVAATVVATVLYIIYSLILCSMQHAGSFC